MTQPSTKSRTTADLSPSQDRVALLLASGWSVRAAAAEASVGERTIFGWRADLPAFNKQVEQHRSELFANALGKLADISGKAVELLEKLVDDVLVDPNVRLQAAKAILDQAPKYRASVEIETRLAELERSMLTKGKR